MMKFYIPCKFSVHTEQLKVEEAGGNGGFELNMNCRLKYITCNLMFFPGLKAKTCKM